MKKKLVFIVLSLTVILSILIFYAIDNRKRLYDESKPNIFEIPGTASQSIDYYDEYYHYYFMVQEFPLTEMGMRNMLETFIEDNHTLVSNAFAKDSTKKTYVFFHFMKPSRQFPVYFEENKSYFKMDDYVTHYIKTNNIVTVNFKNENDSGSYKFYFDKI